MQRFDLSTLASTWRSPVVSRDKIDVFSGGLLHPRTMANLDALGQGPERIRVGRKIGYPVLSLIAWMKSRQEA
jgi:hypothetical protein